MTGREEDEGAKTEQEKNIYKKERNVYKNSVIIREEG